MTLEVGTGGLGAATNGAYTVASITLTSGQLRSTYDGNAVIPASSTTAGFAITSNYGGFGEVDFWCLVNNEDVNNEGFAFYQKTGASTTKQIGALNSTSTTVSLDVYAASGAQAELGGDATTAFTGAVTNHDFFLYANNLERLRCLAAGGVTIPQTLVVTGSVTGSYILSAVGNALTAVGTNRATALQLAAQVNNVTTAASGTGVLLPVGVVGMVITVFNAGANLIKVYASASETIDGTAGSTGVSLTNAKRCQYFFTAANTWISAQLGVVSA